MKTVAEYFKENRSSGIAAKHALQCARTSVEIDELSARTDIDIKLEVLYEHIQVKGNAIVSGDDEFDKEVEDEIMDRLESGDIWAWCTVKITVGKLCETCSNYNYSEPEYLGGCSYKDENQFKQDGYYLEMVNDCLDSIS